MLDRICRVAMPSYSRPPTYLGSARPTSVMTGLIAHSVFETPTDPPARAGPLEAGGIIAGPLLGGLQHEYEWVAAQGQKTDYILMPHSSSPDESS